MPNRFILVFLSICFISCTKSNNTCLKNRAALDIGSGSTKVKVATVNICKKEIVKFLFEEEVPIGFKADLQMKKSGKDNILSDQILKYGFEEIKKIHEKIKRYDLDDTIGVATSAFRTANNAIYFFSKLKSELGIGVVVVDQLKEAEVGLYSAAIAANKMPDEIIAWDIGGGSMQIVAMVDKKLVVYLGRIGAVSFKDQVISIAKKQNPVEIYSPNPLTMSQFQIGIKIAKKEALKNISPVLKKVIDSENTIFGIGGVHSYSVYEQVSGKNNSYSLEELRKSYSKRVGLTDKEIGGNYSETDVTNLALVSGYMEVLGIKKINILKVNLTEGILVYPEILAK